MSQKKTKVTNKALNTSKANKSAVKGSSKKIQLIMNEIRGKSYNFADSYLKFSPKKTSKVVLKLLQSCRANYEYKHGRVDESRLHLNQAFCTSGTSLKRFQPKSMGRAGRILKRTTHINLELIAK